MTFLNPFVLFGLAAAAIPILIHLLNKRKLRTIEFSTLTFLKELQKNKMRKITVRQWLLLLLRTLVIIFLVLAFSRPALKGNLGTLGSHAKTSLLIILDNTASMDLHSERGKFLDQAKEQALQIVSLMEENDDAIILRLSDLQSLTMETASHDRQKLQSLIQETSVSVVHRTIDVALRSGSTLLQRSKNINKEVYILTDGQLSTLHSVGRERKKKEQVFEPNVKLLYTQFKSTLQNNIGVERISIPPTLLQRNRPVVVAAVVKNFGSTRVENHLASLSIGATRIMQKSISLDGGETGTLEFTFTPTRTGFITGSIRLEDDEFEMDNVHYFSLPIPDNISVTLVSTDETHARYISTALNIANTLSSTSFITVNRITPGQLSTTVARASDVIILSGVKNISDRQQQLLKTYVSDGGSILFFPSTDSLFSDYGYVHQFSIPEFRKNVMKPPGTQFGTIDIQFPIFSGMFDPGQSKNQAIESPDVLRTLSVNLTPAVRPIISLSTGVPFLWMAEYGNGKILSFSVPATTEWSNFPLKGIFVPLLNQSMIYLASQGQLETDKRIYNAGDDVEFTSQQIKKSKNGAQVNLRLIDPENRISSLRTFSKMSPNGVTQTIYTGEPLFNLGHHYVVADRETVFTFPVNLKSDESESILAEHDDVVSSFEQAGIRSSAITIMEPGSSLRETVFQSRFGIELWRYFALLAVLCAVIEMIVAREKKGS
ncbi:MAG: BatA domain-containing protein [Ignavibacteriales bacterium]|nr:BatA domain-containing protein [Ignavibacteriales bacterium]